jgi:diguanylate cyclase (GGDEF)-like protein
VVAPIFVGAAPDTGGEALVAAGVLAGSAAACELVRRVLGRVPVWLVGVSLLVDGACLIAALAFTGGPRGALGLLPAIHLVAVTLLASYRTGLKVAVWYSLLLAVGYHAQRAALVPGVAPPQDEVVQAAVMLWLVALFTATCSAYNERELRRSRAGFRALAEMGARLEQVEGPAPVFEALLEAVTDHTGFGRAAVIARRDDERAEAMGWPDRRVLVVPAIEVVSGGSVGRCWHGRGPVLAATLDPVGDRVLDELLPGAHNVAVVPLSTDDGVLGVLAVERGGRRRARIPASVVELVGQFAARAALAHRNATLVEQMRRMAAVDGLTGLANRRAFDEALITEVHRAHRTGQRLSLILLDADHFKRINDTHGHGVGDDVLRAIGRELLGGRATDVPARYGGEEFAILLPACDGAEAVRVADRMRARITTATGRLAVTASAGVASLSEHVADATELLAAADAALYRAKASGRDRTVRAERHTPRLPV